MFKNKLTFAVITTLAFALWVLPQASLADDHDGGDHHDGDHHDGRGGEVKLKGFYNDAFNKVKAEYEANAQKNESKFDGEVKFNLPSSTFDIIDVPDAKSTDLQMDLHRSGSMTLYATCMLDLKKAKIKGGVTQVEYKVEVKNRNGFLQTKIGYCDIDLSTPGVQAGVPAVQAGDVFHVITADGSIVFAYFF